MEGQNRKAVAETGFKALPEDCVSAVISFTTPRDACRSGCVSTTFKSAADSDSVWSRFIPLDYLTNVPSSHPILSKKELYFQACHNPILIDDGKLSYWLDKPSGKKCYMIAARELTIVWGENPTYYGWISLPDARFIEVAELRNVCWFEINGEISTSLLSPATKYVTYLVFKQLESSYGFEDNPVEATVGLAGSEGEKRIIYLDTTSEQNHLNVPERREDGWFESELGAFVNEGDNEGTLCINIMEVNQGNWKSGLVFQGIEIRPKRE